MKIFLANSEKIENILQNMALTEVYMEVEATAHHLQDHVVALVTVCVEQQAVLFVCQEA